MLMVLVGDLQPAEATFPGKNGKIALSAPAEFVPNSRADEVFTIRPNGIKMKQLTSASSSWNPTFSPNGAKIAFARVANSEDTPTRRSLSKTPTAWEGTVSQRVYCPPVVAQASNPGRCGLRRASLLLGC